MLLLNISDTMKIGKILAVLVAAMFLLGIGADGISAHTDVALDEHTEVELSAHTDVALDAELPESAVNPDSALYNLDLAVENLQLSLAGNEEAKDKLRLKFTKERLSEIRKMVAKERFDAAERARDEHKKHFEIIRERINAKKSDNPETEFESDIALEAEIQDQENIVLDLDSEIRAKYKDRLTDEQKAKLDKLLTALSEDSGKTREEAAKKILLTRAKIKERTSKTDEEIDELRNKIEDRKEIAKDRMDKVEQRVERVSNFLEQVKEKAQTLKDKGLESEKANREILNAEKHLAKAKAALEEKKYGEAYGQATAAGRIAINANHLLNKLENRSDKSAELDKEDEKEDEPVDENETEDKTDDADEKEGSESESDVETEVDAEVTTGY